MTTNELITKDDLKNFKAELINEIRNILKGNATEGKAWLKSYEVRKLLHISPGTLQTLRLNGTIKFSKIGGTLYYKTEDINELLEENFRQIQ